MSGFRVCSRGDRYIHTYICIYIYIYIYKYHQGLRAWVSGFGVGTEVVAAVVSEEVREVEPLGRELLDIVHGGRAVREALAHRGEEPVGAVEPPPLHPVR